jgi:hypothetical protein
MSEIDLQAWYFALEERSSIEFVILEDINVNSREYL